MTHSKTCILHCIQGHTHISIHTHKHLTNKTSQKSTYILYVKYSSFSIALSFILCHYWLRLPKLTSWLQFWIMLFCIIPPGVRLPFHLPCSFYCHVITVFCERHMYFRNTFLKYLIKFYHLERTIFIIWQK